MNDKQLEVFVDSIVHYFDTITDDEAAVGTPFLVNSINEHISEFTGVIGISGNHKGSVFFTAPKNMLMYILAQLGIRSTVEDNLLDIVGEVTNTFSGNARKTFGEEFMLSVPIVMKGMSDNIRVSKVVEIYVIPIIWRNLKANLIVNLED